MKNQLNWGILGTAKIAGKSLIPAFHASKLNNLMAVASRSITKAQEFALSNEIPQTADSYEALLDDKAIDAVYIPLPNSLHHPWTIAALQAGKHVLCEKPMALNVEQARQMVSLAEESKLVLMEAYMYRYHPRMDKILGLIQKGELGELRFIHSAFTFNLTNPDNIRLAPDLGGGALMDVGCYCVDISRILSGKEPRAVQALYVEGATGVDLQMAGTLDFGGNLYAQFEAGFNAFSRQHCHIAGTKASLDIEMPFKSSGKRYQAILTTSDEQKYIGFKKSDEYRDMLDHFARLVHGKDKPRYPLSNSIADMIIIDALYQSAIDNGRLVIINPL